MEAGAAASLVELARSVEAHAALEDSSAWQRRLDDRVDEIAPAAESLLDAGEWDAALDLVGSLSVFWQDSGRVELGRQLTTSVLERVPADRRTRAMARAHLVLAELAFRQGDQSTATASSRLAQDIADEVGDGWVGGRAELNLARVAFRDGDATRIFEHANRVMERAGDDLRLRSGAVHMLGWAEHTAGHVASALDRFEENSRIYRQLGDGVGEAGELANIADLAMEVGDLDRATTGLRAAVDVPGATDSRYLGPSLVRSVGVLCGLRARHEAAIHLLAGSDGLYERYGLMEDPGDDVSARVAEAAAAAVGPARAAELDAEGRSSSHSALVAYARHQLR